MSTDTQEASSLPQMTDEELRIRNAKAVVLLDSWARDGDEQEQRETLAVLRKALGPDRVMGYRGALR
jgi:hypothetical protein